MRLKGFVAACEELTVVPLARARLRAGGPVRSAVGGRPCGPAARRCSVCEGGCGTRPFGVRVTSLREVSEPPRCDARCAGNGARQSSPSHRCAAGNPRSPALLGAAHSLPRPPTRSLAGTGSVYSGARKAPAPLRREGSALTGRMGAGSVGRGSKSACADLDGRSGLGLWPSPQRSAERGSPAYPPGRREAMMWAPRSAVPTAASQPPSRSEQHSAPSPKARAATPKPRQGTALGPHVDAAQERLRTSATGRKPASRMDGSNVSS